MIRRRDDLGPWQRRRLQRSTRWQRFALTRIGLLLASLTRTRPLAPAYRPIAPAHVPRPRRP